MDLTPAFFDRWREHRELQYLDRVREVFDQADPDEAWLQTARGRARAMEAQAGLRHSGFEVGEIEGVEAVLAAGATEGVGPVDAVAVRTYAAAYDVTLAAAQQGAAVTPALLDDLHSRLCGGSPGGHDAAATALGDLCDWLAAPPAELHPVVVAALAHLELLRLRPWQDGNARVARMVLLLLLARDGYAYRGLLAPSVAWRDPRRLPDAPVDELSPDKAETHPATEQVVHDVAAAVRDMVAWVRAEESPGTLPEMLFGFPVQP